MGLGLHFSKVRCRVCNKEYTRECNFDEDIS